MSSRDLVAADYCGHAPTDPRAPLCHGCGLGGRVPPRPAPPPDSRRTRRAADVPRRQRNDRSAGFRIDPDQAVAIAEDRPEDATRSTGLTIRSTSGVDVWVGSHYEIFFSYHDKVIADQIVGATAGSGPTYTGAADARDLRPRPLRAGIRLALVLVPFTLMFLLPILLLRRAVARPVRHRRGADVLRLLRAVRHAPPRAVSVAVLSAAPVPDVRMLIRGAGPFFGGEGSTSPTHRCGRSGCSPWW